MSEQGEQAIDATVVEEAPPAQDFGALVPTGGPALAVAPQVQPTELVERLEAIKQAQEKAMVKDVDYGVIPGTDKPTLYKPGAEKLSVLFQLDVQIVNEKVWGPGEHLTVISRATAFHAPSGTRIGYGEGICTTRERKYGKRMQQRTCPSCGAETIFVSKKEGGFFCWKKKGGCGAKFADGDPQIVAQDIGEIENPDLPDLWNTVVKMAEKRGRVDVVLAVTGASALFTQDIEDNAPSPDEEPQQPAAAAAMRPKLDAEKVNQLGAGIGALGLTYRAINLMFGALGLNGLTEESGEGLRAALESLSLAEANALEVEMERVAQDSTATQSQEGGGADA